MFRTHPLPLSYSMYTRTKMNLQKRGVICFMYNIDYVVVCNLQNQISPLSQINLFPLASSFIRKGSGVSYSKYKWGMSDLLNASMNIPKYTLFHCFPMMQHLIIAKA